jgi:hypothetical protein
MGLDTMAYEPDYFEEFLRKIDPLMQSPALYQSLEFACVAARTGSKCVLISGRATLSAEAALPGGKITKPADVDDLVALQGRLRALTVENLVTNLREGWVIDVSESEKVVLPSDQSSRFSWMQPGVFEGSEPRSRWKRSLTIFGHGPGFHEWLTNPAWDRVDNQLRRNTPGFSRFDALCESLGLPARRGQSTNVSFRISAELPARFGRIQSDPTKGTLEVDIECLGWPELMIDWLPDHDFMRVPPGWKRDSAAESHHVSLTVPAAAKKADLILAFAELDADATTAEVAQEKRGPSGTQTGAAPVSEGERWRATGKSLGAGGQGQVLIVEDTLNEYRGRWVKKVLKGINNPKARERFGREVRALQSINHPNILKIIQSDVTAERPYFVAEYCEGGSLHGSGAARYKGDIRATLRVLLPIIDALAAAHSAGVIHRDVKPANILFRKDRTPVVGDFGICYVEGSEGVTSLDEAMGPRHFIAPEMESGGRRLGEPTDRTDVYSLGKLLYWMLSGGLHFDRERHRANSLVQIFNEQRWEHVHQLLDRMVTETPSERLTSGEVKGILERVASLVEGDFAPLAPSVGIRCRFCGMGSYVRANVYSSGRDPSYVGLTKQQEADRSDKGRAAVLRCEDCGHLEWFQLDGVGDPAWWDR